MMGDPIPHEMGHCSPSDHDSWRALYEGSKWSDFHSMKSTIRCNVRRSEEGLPVDPS